MAEKPYILQAYRIIAYRVEVLKEITSLPQSSLELAESLEQLRWLENGYTIKAGIPKWRQSVLIHRRIWNMRNVSCKHETLMNIGSGMLLDRTIQPKVRDIEHLAVQMPQRCTMPNGVSLNVLDSGIMKLCA